MLLLAAALAPGFPGCSSKGGEPDEPALPALDAAAAEGDSGAAADTGVADISPGGGPDGAGAPDGSISPGNGGTARPPPEMHPEGGLSGEVGGQRFHRAAAEILLDENGRPRRYLITGKDCAESVAPPAARSHYDLQGKAYACSAAGLGLRWTAVRHAPTGALLFWLDVKNTTDRPVRLLRSTPFLMDSRTGGYLPWRGKAADLRAVDNGSNVFADVTASIWTGSAKRDLIASGSPIEVRGDIVSNWNVSLRDRANTGDFLVAGFAGVDEAFQTVGLRKTACPAGDAGCVSAWEMFADAPLLFSGRPISPGEEYQGDVFALLGPERERTVFDALETLADLIRESYSSSREPLVTPERPAATGWNSWTGGGGTGGYGQGINESVMAANLQVMKQEFRNFGFARFQIDDGWQQRTGDWIFDAKKFPRGIQGYVGGVEAAGLKPGIWMAPFLAHPESAIARNAPAAKPVDGVAGAVVPRDTAVLDITSPQTLDFLHFIYSLARRERIDWFKVDFTYFAAFTRFSADIPAMKALRNAYRKIREGAGEDAWLLGIGVMGANIGIMDGMRLTSDNGPRWDASDPNTLLGTPRSFKTTVRTGAKRYFYGNRVWQIDNDLLFFRNSREEGAPPLTFNESRAFLSFLGLSGSVMILGDKLVDLRPEAITAIRKFVPVWHGPGRPLDLFERQYPEKWLLRNQRNGLVFHTLGLINWGDNPDFSTEPPSMAPHSPREWRISAGELGLDPAASYAVHELWNGEARVWNASTAFETTIPTRDCRIYTFRRIESGRPLFLASNRHFTQGFTDFVSENWDPATRIYTLTMDVEGPEEGGVEHLLRYAVHIPDGFRYKSFRLEGMELQFPAFSNQGNLLTIEFYGRKKGRVSFVIQF
ncbi:MAG: hypothetical protein GMKNLPBB_02398 [Myxococcota bacterium]|nr:hypothetical protein [Myxococcota bacterium]